MPWVSMPAHTRIKKREQKETDKRTGTHKEEHRKYRQTDRQARTRRPRRPGRRGRSARRRGRSGTRSAACLLAVVGCMAASGQWCVWFCAACLSVYVWQHIGGRGGDDERWGRRWWLLQPVCVLLPLGFWGGGGEGVQRGTPHYTYQSIYQHRRRPCSSGSGLCVVGCRPHSGTYTPMTTTTTQATVEF